MYKRERERERERAKVRYRFSLNQLNRYKYFCRLVKMVIANANIPRVSIEHKWVYSQGKTTELFCFTGDLGLS